MVFSHTTRKWNTTVMSGRFRKTWLLQQLVRWCVLRICHKSKTGRLQAAEPGDMMWYHASSKMYHIGRQIIGLNHMIFPHSACERIDWTSSINSIAMGWRLQVIQGRPMISWTSVSICTNWGKHWKPTSGWASSTLPGSIGSGSELPPENWSTHIQRIKGSESISFHQPTSLTSFSTSLSFSTFSPFLRKWRHLWRSVIHLPRTLWKTIQDYPQGSHCYNWKAQASGYRLFLPATWATHLDKQGQRIIDSMKDLKRCRTCNTSNNLCGLFSVQLAHCLQKRPRFKTSCVGLRGLAQIGLAPVQASEPLRVWPWHVRSICWCQVNVWKSENTA